jgi:hypothetical protein
LASWLMLRAKARTKRGLTTATATPAARAATRAAQPRSLQRHLGGASAIQERRSPRRLTRRRWAARYQRRRPAARLSRRHQPQHRSVAVAVAGSVGATVASSSGPSRLASCRRSSQRTSGLQMVGFWSWYGPTPPAGPKWPERRPTPQRPQARRPAPAPQHKQGMTPRTPRMVEGYPTQLLVPLASLVPWR